MFTTSAIAVHQTHALEQTSIDSFELQTTSIDPRSVRDARLSTPGPTHSPRIFGSQTSSPSSSNSNSVRYFDAASVSTSSGVTPPSTPTSSGAFRTPSDSSFNDSSYASSEYSVSSSVPSPSTATSSAFSSISLSKPTRSCDVVHGNTGRFAFLSMFRRLY